MSKIIEKRNYIILLFIVILSVWILLPKERHPFVKSFNYKKQLITIVIYDNINQKKMKKDIKKICNNKEKDDNDILSGSYKAKKIISYFKKNNIKKYIINENGNISVGKRYNKNKYNISINNPKDNSIVKIVKLEYQTMATHSDGENSISVISNDVIKANTLKYELFDIDINSAKEIVKKNNVKVIWYRNDEILIAQ